MNYFERISPAIGRRLIDRRKITNRNLSFEMLEKRFAFTADLLNSAMAFETPEPEAYYDIAKREIHVSEAVMGPTNRQADPVDPDKTLATLTPTSLADTFRLHSNPGATKRIYLDFDGNVTNGTYWNSDYANNQAIVSGAYDIDGNPADFSNAERSRIQWIWERVSEDFIPFNVDVTTEDPGSAALSNTGGSDTEWGIRVVVGTGNWWTSGGGGITYVGSFNWSTDTPAFVFSNQLGNGDEKYTAEAISHETGHSLGLDHDGRTSPAEEYYSGQGTGSTGWAPIMGNSYYQNVTQWSKNEYLNANNQAEDDLMVITTQNGFSYRNDDHGGTNGTASILDVAGGQISDWGIIERTTDVDAFSFTTGAGTIQINAAPLDRGPNLDISLELYDMANNLIASSNPTELLSASITASVTAQQYVLRVSGTGKGNPLTDGYSRYASLGQYFLSGTIVVVLPQTLAVVASSATKAEGNSGSTPFTFTVSRTGDTSGLTTVDYTVFGSGVNPTNATDFAGGTLDRITFAPGESSKTVMVLVKGDTSIELDEQFTLLMWNASGSATITTNSATGTILNDEVTLSVVAGNATKAEGNSGSTPFTFTVSRTGDTSGLTTVDYTVFGSGVNPTNASDFAGGTLDRITFAPGESSKTVTVLVKGDTTVELDEQFTLLMWNASGSATITTSSATGVILNDEVTLSVVAGNAIKAEGNSGSIPFTFYVSRTGDTSGLTTVDYTVFGSGVNPTNASDFAGGTLDRITFAPGESSKVVTVLVKGDTTVELDEQFTLLMWNASGSATIATNSATGVILNDEVTLSVVAGNATKAEGNSGSTPFTFTVSRTGDTSGLTTVDYTVFGSGVNPTNATDFAGGTLDRITFTPGESSKVVTVLVKGDTTIELDEQFTLLMWNASGSAMITTNSATGVILNDEVNLSVVAGNATKAEGNSGSTPFTFYVSRTGDTSGLTTVDYTVFGSGVNPTNATDFAGGTLDRITFAPGESSRVVTVLIKGDTTVELNEQFTLSMWNASGSAVITSSSATGVIQNDDPVAQGAPNLAIRDTESRYGGIGTIDFPITEIAPPRKSGLNAASAAFTFRFASLESHQKEQSESKRIDIASLHRAFSDIESLLDMLSDT